MAIKQGNPIKNALRYVWDYADSWLDTWPKKIFFALVFILAQTAALYITAFFDAAGIVGIFNLDMSISGLLAVYQEPGNYFPWGTFLVLSLVIDFIAALLIWKNGSPPGGRNFKLSKSNTYGSGREISRRELGQVTEIGDKDTVMGTILGQLDETGKQAIASKAGSMPNDNMLVFGPPGSGKSTSYVLTYIAQAIRRRHSICVSDTKGEVYAKTAELARLHGYKVLRLDLKDPEHSDGWNVLKELRHDDVRALIFAKTVMGNTKTEDGKSSDPHAGAEEGLLNAICLYQERMPSLADSQRTFYNAFALLLQGAAAMDTTFTAAAASYGDEMQVVMDAYAPFLHGSERLRDNVINNLGTRIRVLATPAVRNMTSVDEIDFASLGKEPTILYISMSDQHTTMSFLASLAFSFAFLDLVDLADHSPGQKLQVPCHFLMEEFGNLGRIPNIDKYLSTARSRGISINLVVQSLAQLTGIYEDDMTDTILADCATWMCLGCNDKRTAELLEWRSGEATIEVKTTQHEAAEPPFRLSHRHSAGDGRRNFYTSNDIMKIRARKEAFIVWQQLDSLKCRAFPIFQHQEYEAGHMPEITASSLIPLSNTKAKKIFRDWENKRVRSFNAWVKAGHDPLKSCGINLIKDHSLPDIIPLHSLERMALAKAEGKAYDPTKDPDSAQYVPPREEDEEDMVAEELWDLSDLIFEREPEARPMAQVHSSRTGPNKTNFRKSVEPPEEESRPITTADMELQAEAEIQPASTEPEAAPEEVPASEETTVQAEAPEAAPAPAPVTGNSNDALNEFFGAHAPNAPRTHQNNKPPKPKKEKKRATTKLDGSHQKLSSLDETEPSNREEDL